MIQEACNPFDVTDERYAMWEGLARRDFEAFLAQDWSITASDFCAAEFVGYDACKTSNPDHWRLRFPSLADYRNEWLRQAKEFAAVELCGVSKLDFLFRALVLRDIEICGARAIARKKFHGSAETSKGDTLRLCWQSMFFLKKSGERWLVTGFVGYLPNPSPERI